MSITMPNIDINFKQLATSAIERSERGVAILIITDETTTAPTYKEYIQITDLEEDKSKYTAENYQYIKDVLGFVINKVIIINEDTVVNGLNKVIDHSTTGWITIADRTTEEYNTLATWVKTKETMEKKYYKCVCYKATSPNNRHVVNFVNEKVTFTDSRGEVTGEHYCPSLVGILASCNVTKSTTYYNCTNLKKVTEVADRDTSLKSGELFLINDGEGIVRIGQGINSLTDTGENLTEDMCFIETVEVMDLINDDIRSTFKDYIGSYKNKYANQVLLISAINGYLKELAKSNILDEEYDNKTDIDIESQREVWIKSGKTEASTWTDTQVRIASFKRSVFLVGQVKILGSMTDLKFNVNLF